jgi:hypothetical protein
MDDVVQTATDGVEIDDTLKEVFIYQISVSYG